MKSQEKYEISDFEMSELLDLDLNALYWRCFLLQDKLNDVLHAMYAEVCVNVQEVFKDPDPDVQVSFNEDNGIDCCVKISSTDFTIEEVVRFADALGLEHDAVSVEPDKAGTCFFWQCKKKDISYNL